MTGSCRMENAMHSTLLETLLQSVSLPPPPAPDSLLSLRQMASLQLHTLLKRSSPALSAIANAIAQKAHPHSPLLPMAFPSPTLTSINGLWGKQKLSIPGITLSSLSSLKDPYTASLYASWHRHTSLDEDPLSLLACASYQDALVLSVASDTDVSFPVHILHLLDHTAAFPWAMPRLHLYIGKNSRLTLIETMAVTGFLNTLLSIDIEKGGSLQYTRIDTSSSAPALCSSLHASLKTGASLNSTIASATSLSRHSASILLEEEGASVNLLGLSLLPSSNHSFLSLLIDHQAPFTCSSQQFKGIVAESSSGSFESTVRIRREAKKSVAFQRSHFLTLGASAQTLNRPNFEIFADDVVATHGATSGMLDQEALFYLTSRGLPSHTAREYLIEGFCDEILQKLPKPVIPLFLTHILDTIRGRS